MAEEEAVQPACVVKNEAEADYQAVAKPTADDDTKRKRDEGDDEKKEDDLIAKKRKAADNAKASVEQSDGGALETESNSYVKMNEDAGALKMNEDEDDDFDTMSVPKWVPKSDTFQGETFYVRKCYSEYYDQIMELLKENLYISVTGTPGIGKSLFYLYFFQRYRKEFPHKSLVTASFTRKQKLIRCMLFQPGSFERRKDIPLRLTSDWPADFDCDLYLYDGPPEGRPDLVKMITFTSPNDGWLHVIDNDTSHATVYMPVWTLAELLIAVRVLNLNISEGELKQRIADFGGSARFCLATNAKFLDRGRKKITEALTGITNFQHVQDCINGKLPLKEIVHRLMHYEPVEDNQVGKLHPASSDINASLVKKLSENLSRERNKLMEWLEGADKASAFFGWLYENFVHVELLKGGDYELRSLFDSTTQPIQLKKTEGYYDRFTMSISSSDDAKENVYRIPESSCQPSIDSYMVSESCLLMFQVTIQSKHPIKAFGLVNVLKKLEWLDSVETCPESAKIIFVVPEGTGPKFKTQKITSDLENRCASLKGIGRAISEKLEEHKIRNCKEMILAYENNEAWLDSKLKKIITAFMNDVETIGQLETLRKIPQYVLEVSYKTGNK